MATDTKVSIFLGPLHWFHEQVGDRKREDLMDVVYRRDELARQMRVIIPGESDPADASEKPGRPRRVVAESGDFASLNEHVISNFGGLIRAIRPKHLYLHNPPAQVQAQLQRAIPSTKIRRFSYPLVTRETLTKIRDEFDDHLVGQPAVKDRLLAALYPLTRPEHDRPMVLMFYGPSGAGKTETAQFVNGLLGGTLLRKQFSMFHSEKFASYLFGGSHSEPSLARDLLDRQSGVILIDEFDKANPVFHSAFYELFDTGVFEDKNYAVQLGPSLIICTSNYRSDREVHEALGDALYSRFDAVIQFEELSPADVATVIERIVDARLGKLTESERGSLDRELILGFLRPLANRQGNVRSLGKTIDEMISMLLTKVLLDSEPPAMPPNRI